MYLTRLTGKDLPSLCTCLALLGGSLLVASAALAQERWQRITPTSSIWSLAQEESTLPWEWAQRIQPGVLPDRLGLKTPIPAKGWLIPYRPLLSGWAEVPFRMERPDRSDVTHRLFRYPIRSPRRHPGSLPLLPEQDLAFRNPNLFLWSSKLDPALGDVVLLEPGKTVAKEGDPLWVTGNAEAATVYFLPPGFVTPPGPLAEQGYRFMDGTGQVVGTGRSPTRVEVQTAPAALSIGHRVVGSPVDNLWTPDTPIRFPQRSTAVPGIIPLKANSGTTPMQSVPAGQEVGLPVGAADGVSTGQAWRLVRPGDRRFDPLRQATIQYPDQTIAHVLTLRVYGHASVAFILSGSVPAGVALMLEPV